MSNTTLKKVLVVDDNESFQEACRIVLQDKDVLVLSAFTIEEARQLYAEHQDVSLIVMDGCVPGNRLNTGDLIKEIRMTYRGPMIASSNSYNNRKLIELGCSHGVIKEEVRKTVLELLGIS